MFNTNLNKKESYNRLFKIQLMEIVLVYILLILSYSLAGKLIYNVLFPYEVLVAHLDFLILSALMVVLLGYYKFFRLIDMPYSEVVKKIFFASVLVNIILVLHFYFIIGEMVSIYYFVVAYVLQIMLLVMLKLFSGLFKKKIINEGFDLVVVQDIRVSPLVMALKNHCKRKLAIASPEDPKLKEFVDQASKIYLTGFLTKKLKKDLITYCDLKNKQVCLVPEIFDIIIRNSRVTHIGDTPVFEVGSFQLTESQNIIKRAEDIFLSVVGIILTIPIMLFATIGIKLEDGGPVFFRQERCGIKGKTFNVIKFRSMVVDAEKYTGAIFAEKNDPRITKIGRFLRSKRIDEIPQFFNVLVGSMSIVGPRPERPVFVESFKNECPEYCHRFAMKPGITGLAQVMGNYTTTAENKIKFDLMYIINYSFLLDIKILFQTVKVIFKREQAEGFSKQNKSNIFNLEQFSENEFNETQTKKRSIRGIKEILFFCFCILIVMVATFFRYNEIAKDLVGVTTQIVEDNKSVAKSDSLLNSFVATVDRIKESKDNFDVMGNIMIIKEKIRMDYDLFRKLDFNELVFLEKIAESNWTEEEKTAVLAITNKLSIP